ncbi:hypothetical protein WICPIJ_006408 [Wickerhamomyces pijperi]|uniref:Uncharacterized protein n=1 Tax=Wickerhamomyces pijperi TaxID=599730 RepID=A0A9P8Q4G5_WICPI|nr:hypothetical protein WICPIJ_006408 [Wickerhamomyces pijperi]
MFRASCLVLNLVSCSWSTVRLSMSSKMQTGLKDPFLLNDIAHQVTCSGSRFKVCAISDLKSIVRAKIKPFKVARERLSVEIDLSVEILISSILLLLGLFDKILLDVLADVGWSIGISNVLKNTSLVVSLDVHQHIGVCLAADLISLVLLLGHSFDRLLSHTEVFLKHLSFGDSPDSVIIKSVPFVRLVWSDHCVVVTIGNITSVDQDTVKIINARLHLFTILSVQERRKINRFREFMTIVDLRQGFSLKVKVKTFQLQMKNRCADVILERLGQVVEVLDVQLDIPEIFNS